MAAAGRPSTVATYTRKRDPYTAATVRSLCSGSRRAARQRASARGSPSSQTLPQTRQSSACPSRHPEAMAFRMTAASMASFTSRSISVRSSAAS